MDKEKSTKGILEEMFFEGLLDNVLTGNLPESFLELVKERGRRDVARTVQGLLRSMQILLSIVDKGATYSAKLFPATWDGAGNTVYYAEYEGAYPYMAVHAERLVEILERKGNYDGLNAEDKMLLAEIKANPEIDYWLVYCD